MKFLVIALLALNFLIGPVAYAQQGEVVGPGDQGPVVEGGTVSLQNPLAADNILELFEAIIDVILVFAVPIIVFFIIYAGFLYVTARGNEGTIEKAHKALLYALIGGLLILGANVLIDVIQGTVDCVRDIEGNCST